MRGAQEDGFSGRFFHVIDSSLYLLRVKVDRRRLCALRW